MQHDGLVATGTRKENAAVIDFAFGSEQGRLNLKSVLLKTRELYTSLCRLEAEVHFDANNKRWHQLIDLFSMMRLQYNALLDQLRDNLEYWAIYPKRVEQELAMKLQGGMISPKLLVEMENENESVLLEAGGDLRRGQETVTHLNEVVERLSSHLEGSPNSGVVDPRGPLVSGILAEMRRDRKARASQLQKHSTSDPKLEKMVNFMKSGAV